MADRLPQYPMLSSFSPIQQQQQAQLQQHHQQSQQQQAQQQHQAQQHLQQQLQQHNAAANQQLQEQHPGMQPNQPSMDQSRAWQQMYQLQPQNRPNGGDMNPQQMADIMKRQIAQNQNQAAQRQQMLQNHQAAQQQQNFMPTMGGGPIIGTSSQQPPFHEPTAGHPQPGHMAPAFPNIGAGPAGNVNQGPSVPRTPQQQPNVIQRQLELMSAAQNQLNQNGPIKMNNAQLMQQQQQQMLREREHQQQQAAQQQHQLPFQQPSGMTHNPGDIFSQGMPNDAMRRPSPHPNAIQQTPSAQGGPSQPNPMMHIPPALQMQRQKAIQLEGQIRQLQQELNNLRGSGTPEEQMAMGKLKNAEELSKQTKEIYSRMVLQFNASRQQLMGASGGVAPGLGPGSQPPGWNGPPQPPFGPDMQAIRNQAGALAGQANMPSTTPMQASASLPQTLGQNLIQQGLVPPRTGPTPQQQPLIGGQPASNLNAPSQPQHGNFTSPFNNTANGTNQPFPFPPNGSKVGGPGSAPGPSRLQPGVVGGGNPAISGLASIPPQLIKTIPPMEKTRFDVNYRTFLQKSNIPSAPIVVDGRTIDPHRLHVEVMKEGGWIGIDSKDLWTVVGARLGFMQFPGSDTEPARSGPVIGQQIQNCYKTQIAPFDIFYITQTLKQQQQQRPSQPPDAGSLFNLGLSGMSPHNLGELVKMSQISVADLKAQNVDDKTIQYVEHNRATLQRHLQDQKLFSAQLKVRSQSDQGNPPGGPAMGPRPAGLAAPPFPQTGSGPSTMLTPQQQQQLMMQRQLYQQQQMQMNLGPQGQRAPLPHTGPQHPGPMPPQPMITNGVPVPGVPKTPMDINAGQQLLQKMKSAYMTDAMSKTVEVPLENQMEFNQILGNLHRQTTESEVKLISLAAMVGTQGPQQQEAVRRFMVIVATIQAQRQALSTSAPRYLMDLQTLKNMVTEFSRVMDLLQSIINQMRFNPQHQHAMAQRQKMQQQLQFAQAAQLAGNRIPMVPQPPNLPGSMQPQPSGMQQPMQAVPPHPPQQPPPPSQPPHQQQPPPPYQHMPQQMQPPLNGSLRQPPNLLQPPVKRKAPGNGSASSPSPAPVQASTPATSAPTPTATAASPPAGVKSPKARATPKTKPATTKARRPSKAAPPNPPSTAPAVEQSPSANGSAGNKRPREEDAPDAATPGAMSIAGEPSPPKRAKTEWESEPTEELKKQEEAVENLKSEEDASAFLDHFTEFFKQQASGGNPPESLTSGLSETIDILLKGYPPTGEMPGGMLTSEASGSSIKREPSPPLEAYDQFFDFSDFTVGGDQEDFKAPTPELSISASSTNPSPESNHEAEASQHALSAAAFPDIKSEDTASMLGVGPWKDVDAGEGIFFQPTAWSWETPMPSLDPPWAISNS